MAVSLIGFFLQLQFESFTPALAFATAPRFAVCFTFAYRFLSSSSFLLLQLDKPAGAGAPALCADLGGLQFLNSQFTFENFFATISVRNFIFKMKTLDSTEEAYLVYPRDI